VRCTGSAPIEQMIPGAQLVVRYSIYRHYGIYAGGGRVIHYAGWVRGRRGLVEEISLDEFTEGREFNVNLNPPDVGSGRDVVRRARSRLGERCYNLLENNCEHFSTWCRLGKPRSVQVELMAKPLRLAIAALQVLWSVMSALPPESSAGATRSREEGPVSPGHVQAPLPIGFVRPGIPHRQAGCRANGGIRGSP
jgi:hypothetical protein